MHPDIASLRGVRQGDPLGPLLFALTAQFILAEAKTCGIEAKAFLDDGTFTTQEAYSSDALHRLQTCLARIQAAATEFGMTLQLTKCLLLWFHASPVPDELRTWAEANGIEIETKAARILGSPVGASQVAREQLLQKMLKPHDKLLFCARPKFNLIFPKTDEETPLSQSLSKNLLRHTNTKKKLH